MTGKSDVLLTYADLLRLREEDKEIDKSIRDLVQRQAEVKRKLQAAEVFASEPSGPQANGHEQSSEEATPEEAETPPNALLADMRKSGESLNVKAIKARLIALGFAHRIKTQPNYHYQLTYRLVRAGKLLKRGSKYRAAPIVSPEGETEAGGASVRH